MLRLIKSKTLKNVADCCNTPAVRRFSLLSYVSKKKPNTTQVILSNLRHRQMSSLTKQSSDALLVAAGTGILVATCTAAYLFSNTEHVPDKKDHQQNAEEKSEVIGQMDIDSEEHSQDDDQAETAEVISFLPIQTPESVPYLIIGAGTAAHTACRAIKKNHKDAKILIIGEENVLPYMRPPLSKELWFNENPDVANSLVFKSWNGKERSIFFEDESYYAEPKDLTSNDDGGVAVVTGRRVSSIDAEEHSVTLNSGEKISYEKLLIATGGRPKNHPVFSKAGKNVSRRTTLFRNVSDFRQLDKKLKSFDSVVVVGGGFLGSELAYALAATAKRTKIKVMQIYGEDGNMAKILPRYLSEWTTRKVKEEGVDVVANRTITEACCRNNQVEIQLDNGDKVVADHVVVCVGIEPNIELASSAGLEVDPENGGFRVNAELEARSDIWVAGDASCFYDINLGRRRVEHHDHAVVSGRLAGENMTGAKKVYKHQSMFWSDLGPEVGYEAIGIVDSALPTVGVWAKATPADTPKAAAEATGESIPSEREEAVEQSPVASSTVTTSASEEEEFGKGVVFYMKEKKIVGVLLWNIFSLMPVARQIISDGKQHDDLNSVAKLFNIHQ